MLKKCFVSIFLFVLVVMFGSVTSSDAASPFTDVSNKHSNYEAISWAKNEGITSGYEDGTFKPKNTVSEGQFIKMVNSFLNVPASSQKIQKSTIHAYDDIYNSAAMYGIPLNGYFNDQYRVQPINRGLVAQVLASYMGVEGDMSKQIQFLIDNKISNGQNSNFKNKLGYEDIYFGSENNLTRAHAIQFLYNMHKQQLKDVKASEKTGNVTTLANQAQQKVNIAMMKQPEAFVKTGTSSKLYAAGVQYIVYKNGMVETIYASKPHGKIDSLLLVDAKGKTLLKSVGTLADDQYNISNIVFLSNGNIQVDKYKTRYTFNKNGKIVSKKSITYKFDSPSMSHFAKKKSNGSDSVLEIYNAKTNKIEFSYKFEGSRFFDLALIGDNHYVVTCDKDSDNYCYAVFDKKGNKLYEVNRPDEEAGMVSHYREPVYISTSGRLYVKEKQFLEGKNGMDGYELFYGFDDKGNVVSKSKLSTKEILAFDKEDNQPYIAAAYGHSIDSKSMMTESINIYKFK